MSIENNLFKQHSPDFKKLQEYGFKEINGVFTIEKIFKDNLFKAVVEVSSEGSVSGTVYDIENEDEFLPLRVESNQGAFVGEVRTNYIELLEDIKEKCFTKKYYIYPQSNRIANMIIQKYGDEPEFLWKTTPGSGIFRNPETNKWYVAILDVDRSKIQPDKKGLIEVADIKLAPDKVKKLVLEEHFYPGYHMNKKYWLSVILDDTVSDEKIMELIEESHGFTLKKGEK